MPLVPFSALPDSARIWIFASDEPLTGAAADTLLAGVDDYLQNWKAHAMPLRAARDWREGRFLTIGIDPTAEQASGCSIDGLFRALVQMERVVGSKLVGGGRVFYRAADGALARATREEFESLVARGSASAATRVFDLSLTSLADWKERFETEARSAKLTPATTGPAAPDARA